MASKAEGDPVEIEAGGRVVEISHPEKVLFSERGDTKLDLVRYYQTVERPLLACMGGRPVLLQRFPNGAEGSSFFQKRVPENRPEWLETTIVETPNGTTSRRSSPPTWLTFSGRSIWPASGSTCGRPGPTTPTTPTSYASTSIPRPG